MYQDYEKIKNDIQNQLQMYQNTNDLFDLKKLNDGDEAENILVMRNTLFIGNNKMQIKKLDGTIEKYTIERYFPVDEKDEQIKELHKKIEELERRINDEPTKHPISDRERNEPNANDDEYVESESKAIVESVQE